MSFNNLLAGFGINLLVALLIVRFIYYPAKHDKNYVFTFLAFNTVIYFVMSMLATTSLGVGVGFGLFAIFSVVRYRTITMSPREMTYLFVLIALPMLNSLMLQSAAWASIVVVNAAIAMVLFVLEREWGFKYESAQLVQYEQIELIKPEHHCTLLDDLRQRTGLPVSRVEVGRINFVNDSVELKIYFSEPQSRRRTLHHELGQLDD